MYAVEIAELIYASFFNQYQKILETTDPRDSIYIPLSFRFNKYYNQDLYDYVVQYKYFTVTCNADNTIHVNLNSHIDTANPIILGILSDKIKNNFGDMLKFKFQHLIEKSFRYGDTINYDTGLYCIKIIIRRKYRVKIKKEVSKK